MSMDRRQREALDRHITGNYGEDQFREEREYDVDEDGEPVRHTSSKKDGNGALAETPLTPAFFAMSGADERRRNDCGCELVRHGSYVQVYQCQMHAAAAEMLTALEGLSAGMWEATNPVDYSTPRVTGAQVQQARAAIRKARGQ